MIARIPLATVLVLSLGVQALGARVALGADDAQRERQAAEYRAATAKTILELQPFRQTEQVADATLVDLNPSINRWFVLTLERPGGLRRSYHLENPDPHGQRLQLGEDGIRIASPVGGFDCPLSGDDGQALLTVAQRSGLPDAPLCGGRLYLRNRVAGVSGNIGRVTDFLRDHVWGGEAIVGFVRRRFYADRYLERGVPGAQGAEPADAATGGGPRPALLRPAMPDDRSFAPNSLGIELGRSAASLLQGRWYQAAGLDGIHVSFVRPQSVAPEDLARGSVNEMDAVEGDALAYFVAFDLGRFDLGFALGTDHPRVGWSDRPPRSLRDSLPGPDGIDSTAPLVTNGMISPWLAAGTVATFTGGFKRQHGAFKYGELAERNRGTHYGFIEDGAIFSKLMPGLATVYVLDDGTVEMKTWREADDALLPRIVHARQNGVAIIEHDAAAKRSFPGPLVTRWGPGNWSGSADEKLRTLRAGLCLQESGTRRFLVYGYFSTATPSAMAWVFQAYRCRYAMHLDMNALEHTYLALYRSDRALVETEHLVEGMSALDKNIDDGVLPRFLMVPDDRDFFYLTRREATR